MLNSTTATLLIMTAALLLVSASGACADECDHATTQNELNNCAEDNYHVADKNLNDVWTALPDDMRAKYRQEQRDWIAARDRKCKTTAAEAEGGSMYPLLYFGCLTDETRTRTRWLRAHDARSN